MPPEDAKKLFGQLHAATERGAEQVASTSDQKIEKSNPEMSKKPTEVKEEKVKPQRAAGMLQGLTLKKHPRRDRFTEWQEEHQ